MMEIDELIMRHSDETEQALQSGGVPAGHALRQVSNLIGHARYIELQRNEARDMLRQAVTICAGMINPDTLEAWKRTAGIPKGASIHDTDNANLSGVETAERKV